MASNLLKNRLNNTIMAIAFLFAAVTQTARTQEISPEELEAWFEDDTHVSPVDTVNEGELEFLSKPPQKPALHSKNKLTINKSSLADGWVSLYQCYANLDAVAEAQVVYQFKKIKNLSIEKQTRIEKAWVQGQSVQLLNTLKGATLCISADVHIFHKTNDNLFVLKNGPFQRQFLDGYYPMHVTLDIAYPSQLLAVSFTKPRPQPGFDVQHKPGILIIDTWFEGMLFTEVSFEKHK